MRFRLYREYGALNSVPIFDAFEQGLKSLGHEIVKTGEDVAVIWSVLWAGRMASNQKIYNHCIQTGTPIIIIEVGNLKRNSTWRISLNHINGEGIFGNDSDLDVNRPSKLGVSLKPIKENRRPEILIATQHQQSLQWAGQPSMEQWVNNIVKEIRQHSQRKILLRPHPRSKFSVSNREVQMITPQKILGSYDDFDIDYNYHCVINHNSGPAVQAAIHGTPVLCDVSSLAAPMSITWNQLENPVLPDRQDWFLRLCHTEWTVDEIRQGIPLQRLLSKIN